MSPTLTFYTNPMSRARMTRWMLEETGLPYEEVVLAFDTTMKSPEYLAINPMGKVPAIRHGDVVVTENAAVCAYLADLVPEKRLAPAPGSPERGSYYRWLFFLAGPLESLRTAKGQRPLRPAARPPYEAARGPTRIAAPSAAAATSANATSTKASASELPCAMKPISAGPASTPA